MTSLAGSSFWEVNKNLDHVLSGPGTASEAVNGPITVSWLSNRATIRLRKKAIKLNSQIAALNLCLAGPLGPHRRD